MSEFVSHTRMRGSLSNIMLIFTRPHSANSEMKNCYRIDIIFSDDLRYYFST